MRSGKLAYLKPDLTSHDSSQAGRRVLGVFGVSAAAVALTVVASVVYYVYSSGSCICVYKKRIRCVVESILAINRFAGGGSGAGATGLEWPGQAELKSFSRAMESPASGYQLRLCLAVAVGRAVEF